MADNTLENKHNWYVFRVFGNRALSCEQKLKAIGFETYVPVLTRWKEGENGKPEAKIVPAISNLIFINTTEEKILELEQDKSLSVYAFRTLESDPSKRKLTVIPRQEMDSFIFISSSGEKGLEYFPADQLAYKSGTKVRVTAGLLKGSVGEIKRIKGNRRFVVEIQGICAIATSYIPSEFLQKL